jgi:hypothetical protein
MRLRGGEYLQIRDKSLKRGYRCSTFSVIFIAERYAAFGGRVVLWWAVAAWGTTAQREEIESCRRI